MCKTYFQKKKFVWRNFKNVKRSWCGYFIV